MTVHARQLARQCRERMAARDEQSLIQRRPERQQQAPEARTATSESTRPMSRQTLRV